MTVDEPRPPIFDGSFRDRFEQLLAWRRDVRHFRGEPPEPSLLDHLIHLACLSPSVGNSQPWRFVHVRDPGRRAAVRASFEACNRDALAGYLGDDARLYASLKLSGLDDAPVQLAVFSDHDTPAGRGLGRQTMPETLDYSVVTAIYSFWLAARIHGLGVGWVSILDPARVREIVEVPGAWSLVGYLCVGFPKEEHDLPELVRLGWQERETRDRFVLER